MNIGIIGGGSIGLLLAYYLSIQDNQITIYVKRESQKKRLNSCGISVFSKTKRARVTCLLVEEIKDEDILFICVKQHQLDKLWSTIKNITCPMVFIQNGMGHLDDLSNYRDTKNILVASVEHGAKKLDDNSIEHNGSGVIKVASFSGDKKIVHKIVSQLHTDEFPFQVMEDWYDMLAKKLVINAVINPVTAIFQVENGEIIQNPYLLKLCKQLCNESVAVLGLDEQEMWKSVVLVATNTKNNHSSMKVDVSNKKRTEIDGISGYIIRKSDYNIPYTNFVYNSIKSFEISSTC